MHTGMPPKPSFSSFASSLGGLGLEVDAVGTVNVLARWPRSSRAGSGHRRRRTGTCRRCDRPRRRSRTGARPRRPAPGRPRRPWPTPRSRATFTPSSRHLSSTSFSSASVSVGKRLMATTHGRLYTFVMFSTCCSRLGRPASSACRFSSLSCVLRHAAVVLERADRGHHDHGVGLQAGQAALDVQELLRAQVGAEAGLGDGVVAQRAGPSAWP